MAVAPGITACEEGDTASVKSGVITFSSALAVRAKPLTPKTVKVTAPSGVVADVLTVSVAVPGGAGLGEKLQLTPAGKPLLQDRLTEAVKPPLAIMLTV